MFSVCNFGIVVDCLISSTANLPDVTPLQQVQVPVIGSKQCSCLYDSVVDITDKMICAGEANKGACQVTLIISGGEKGESIKSNLILPIILFL